MGRTTCTEPQCLYKGDLYLYNRLIISIQFKYYHNWMFRINVECNTGVLLQ